MLSEDINALKTISVGKNYGFISSVSDLENLDLEVH